MVIAIFVLVLIVLDRRLRRDGHSIPKLGRIEWGVVIDWTLRGELWILLIRVVIVVLLIDRHERFLLHISFMLAVVASTIFVANGVVVTGIMAMPSWWAHGHSLGKRSSRIGSLEGRNTRVGILRRSFAMVTVNRRLLVVVCLMSRVWRSSFAFGSGSRILRVVDVRELSVSHGSTAFMLLTW